MSTPNFNVVIGPLLLGTVGNAMVFGVCVLQYIQYLATGYKDSWYIIALLLWVMVVDTFQTGTSIALMWHYVVDNFTNPKALGESPWMYATLPIFNTIASIPIQFFMAWRIMRLSKSMWLFVYVAALSLSQGALAVSSSIKGLLSPTIVDHVKIIPFADAWLALSVACDISLTFLLLYYLNKGRTGFKRTDSIVFRICRITVEAALPVSILCILDLIFLTTNPFNNLHFMCAMPVGRLYTNTLLTTLNARESLRQAVENSDHNSYHAGTRDVNNRLRPGHHTTEVRINVEQNVQMESYKMDRARSSSDITHGTSPAEIKASNIA